MTNIISVLENQITESDSSGAETGEQRERNHRYWAMMPLGNEEPGRSHYVDPAVHGNVEAKKAIFSETFLSTRQVVKFSGGKDKSQDDAKTAYVQRVLKANQYERLFRDGWHDAFVAKKQTVWVSWEEDTETVELRFQGAPTQIVMQQLQELGEIVDVDQSQLQSQPVPGPVGQMGYTQPILVHTGVLSVEVDSSRVKLDLIQPEYVYRDPAQTYCDDAMWNTAQMDVPRGVLVEMGFDPDQVESLMPDYRFGQSQEDYARKAHDRSGGSYMQHQRSGPQEEVTVYRTRTWLDLQEGDIEGFEPEQGWALYELYWGHGEILNWAEGAPAIQAIDCMNVYEWCEIPISHSESGMCTADVEAHQQKATSQLKRGVIDNMHITNNPRWEAVIDRIHNPRDLTDNVIGATIDVDAPGSVAPLMSPPLSPMVMGVLQMMESDSEERSGVSSLAKGMNQAAVSSQNADDMIARLTNAGQRRVAMAARDFANTFLIPLMQGIVKLAIKRDESVDQMESGGRVIPIAPSQWDEDEIGMELDVALTPDEAAEMSRKLLIMHNLQKEDEDMKALYGAKQKHAMFDTIYELMGIKDSTPFLGTPESPEYQQFMQKQEQDQAQMKQIAMMQAERQDQLAETQIESISQQVQIGWANLNNNIMDTAHDNTLDDDKFDWQQYMDRSDNFFKEEELKLEEEQERGVSL